MATDNSKSRFPLAGGAQDGWSNEDEATATCFCGAVQLAFVSTQLYVPHTDFDVRKSNLTSSSSQPTHGPGLINTFVCNCADCHKITASMFASNFTVDDAYIKHIRGRDNLKTYAQSKTIASGNTMTNFFCSTCGALMYRQSSGYPGTSFLRIGSVDDFNLQETKLRPQMELFIKERVAWLSGVEGAKKFEGMM